MDIKGKVGVITGAASGIGRAAAAELHRHGIAALALVDLAPAVHEVAAELNRLNGDRVVRAFQGDTTDAGFRHEVFETMRHAHGPVNICVPAAGITRDALAVKLNRDRGKALTYPIEDFRKVLEVNLIAPVYWALEMVAQLAESRFVRGLKQWSPEEGTQGVVVFIGSVSSQGNKGQIAYATAKVGLEGAASTLMKEAMYYGVRCAVLHPGFTDTPMVRALGDDYIETHVLPATQIKRLIRPEEIADAISFLIRNSAVSGQLWADAGWHPMPT
jgi:NAD(P)-dependent dehydrogenase (short-subunit alcohol dehydrogenase family)